MRAAAALALALTATAAGPALAQEPDRLERLAGLCHDDGSLLLGRYVGRVLWMADGQLSGMLTRDDGAELPEDATLREGTSPRTMTVRRQTPETVDGGLLLHTTIVSADEDGGDLAETAVVCVVSGVAPERPNPGATSSG